MAKKRYRYRAYPNGGQAHALSRLFGCVRLAWNDALNASDAHRKTTGARLDRAALSKNLTVSKTTIEREWMNEVSAVPLQQALQDLHQAYGNFFDSITGKRKGPKMNPPRHKKRTHEQKARFTQNARFHVTQTTHGVGFVTLPKIGKVRFELSRRLPADPSSITVIKEPDGRYYVSFVVEVEQAAAPKSNDQRPLIGVDLGLSDLAAVVTTNGTRDRVDNPRWARTRAVKLARAQRAYARTKPGSKNRDKARVKVAVQHRKTREARADHHHKLALRLVRDNQTVALETLSPAGLGQTRLARSIYDAAWANLARLIKEKAPRYGTTVVPISRWEPTTQTCCVCGNPGGKKPLHIREWTCNGCGTRLDRDYNAAVNIMVAAGLAHHLDHASCGCDVLDAPTRSGETPNACGGSVRRQLAVADPKPAHAEETGTHRTDRHTSAA